MILMKPDEPKISVENATTEQLGGVTGKGFLPGVSGNPEGRPKGTLQIPAMLKKIGDELAPESVVAKVKKHYTFNKNYKPTMFECFIRLAYIEAVNGNSKAWDFVSERTEGKVPQSMKIEIVRKPIEAGENPMAYLTEYLNPAKEIQA